MPPPPNSMLCLMYKLLERQELSSQVQSHLHKTLKFKGREIGFRIFVSDCSSLVSNCYSVFLLSTLNLKCLVSIKWSNTR